MPARAIKAPLLAPARDRADPVKRREMSGPAMRSFLNIAAAWGLSVEEQLALLGWPAKSTYHKYKSGHVGVLGFDLLMRISIVIGLYKALHILYAHDTLANSWIRMPNTNPMFGGKSPLAIMVDGGMDAMLRVRRLLDARRGGWN